MENSLIYFQNIIYFETFRNTGSAWRNLFIENEMLNDTCEGQQFNNNRVLTIISQHSTFPLENLKTEDNKQHIEEGVVKITTLCWKVLLLLHVSHLMLE